MTLNDYIISLKKKMSNVVSYGTWTDDHFRWLQKWLEDPEESFRSIARDEGVSKSTVASRLKKLLPILRRHIAENFEDGFFEFIHCESNEKLLEYMADDEYQELQEMVEGERIPDIHETWEVEDTFEDLDDDAEYLDDIDQFDEQEKEKVRDGGPVNYTGIVSDQSVSIITQDGNQFTVNAENKNFQLIKEALYERAGLHYIEDLIDTGKAIAKRLDGLEYKAGKLYFGEIEVSSSMVPRIMQSDHIEHTEYSEALKNFFERLVENPYREVVDQLYRFLSANSLPITKTGNFLAYKIVRNNYKDCHTGTIDNSVGAEPEMKRIQVVRDPSRTCEAGYHVCSYNYLNGPVSGDRIMVCEVDPANVVSVPNDYNNSKMRVCKYKVIGEIGNGWEHDDMETFYHNDIKKEV